ncbi:hypothetical protein Vi05172_g2601 [Venturia inaequalis]|nr:hypothetical protein Vi05172_g2601 [Venturia inaequalis]
MAFASAVEVLSREWNNELETEREQEELGSTSATAKTDSDKH